MYFLIVKKLQTARSFDLLMLKKLTFNLESLLCAHMRICMRYWSVWKWNQDALLIGVEMNQNLIELV